jgi:hypothetical protein
MFSDKKLCDLLFGKFWFHTLLSFSDLLLFLRSQKLVIDQELLVGRQHPVAIALQIVTEGKSDMNAKQAAKTAYCAVAPGNQQADGVIQLRDILLNSSRQRFGLALALFLSRLRLLFGRFLDGFIVFEHGRTPLQVVVSV